MRTLGTTLPDPAEAVANGLGGLVAQGGAAAGATVLAAAGDAIARGLAGACGQAAEAALAALAATTGPTFDAGWWTSPRTGRVLAVVASLAAVVMMACLLLALLQGLLAGEPFGVLRALVVEAPVSVGAMVVLSALSALLLGAVDAASAAVLAGVPEDLGRFWGSFGATANVASSGLLGVILLVVFLIGALLVWVELVVRSTLLYLLVAAAPLALAARVWPATRGMARRLVELGLALVVSKFVIALALALGAAALAGGADPAAPAGGGADPAAPAGAVAASPVGGPEGPGLGPGGLLAGAALMLVAAFSPFVVLKVLPMVEAAGVAQGISRSPARAAQTGMQAAYYGQGLRRLTSRGGGRPAGPPPPGGGTTGPGQPPGGPGRGPRPGGSAGPRGGRPGPGGAPASPTPGPATPGLAAVATLPVGSTRAAGRPARRRASAVVPAPGGERPRRAPGRTAP